MPFALVFIGMLLVISGFQNTYGQLGAQVQKDFTGPGNFIYWIIAIGVVGALGYVKDLEKLSRLVMGLLIVVMVLANRGFFAQLNPALQSGANAPVNPVGAPLVQSGGSAASGGGGDMGSAFTDAFISSFVSSL